MSPDAVNQYQLWSMKISNISQQLATKFNASNFIEQNAIKFSGEVGFCITNNNISRLPVEKEISSSLQLLSVFLQCSPSILKLDRERRDKQ
jgi:hypothetical protein